MNHCRRTSCGKFLNQDSTPVFISYSKDDLFFVELNLPPLKINPIQCLHIEYGSHCGYVFHSVYDNEY